MCSPLLCPKRGRPAGFLPDNLTGTEPDRRRALSREGPPLFQANPTNRLLWLKSRFSTRHSEMENSPLGRV